MAAVSKYLDKKGRPLISQEYVVPKPTEVPDSSVLVPWDDRFRYRSIHHISMNPSFRGTMGSMGNAGDMRAMREADASVAPPPVSCSNAKAANAVFSTWEVRAVGTARMGWMFIAT